MNFVFLVPEHKLFPKCVSACKHALLLVLEALALLVPTSTNHFISVQLSSECHKLGHDFSSQFVLHKANDLLVNSQEERTNVAVATCVKPSLNIAGNVFVEIINLDVVNQGVGVHVTQPKICTIFWLHVVTVKLVHHDLTRIKNGLPKS